MTIEADDILSQLRLRERPVRRPDLPRPIILGVVGDSAAGKTTITRGLVRLLGEDDVTHIAADDYHRYDRKQRAERGITPLDPECNYMDIMEQHLAEVRAGRPILKPVYRHQDGTFGPPVYVTPRRFTIVEGLLGYHTRACATSTTCASTCRRRRTCGASGRWTATARGAGTRPTRCSRSSTAARPTRPGTSARRSASPTSSSPSRPASAATPSGSTPA